MEPGGEHGRKATLSVSRETYIYFVTTYGTLTGRIGDQAKRLLEERGVTLSAQFCVKMPDTWTPVFDLSDPESVKGMVTKAEEQLENVTRDVRDREPVDAMRGKTPRLAARLFHRAYESARKTKRLRVTDACVGCGLCAKQCPVRAIEMREGRPAWVKPQCAMCLSCLHRCPRFAIQYGKRTAEHGQYTYPKGGDIGGPSR